LEVTKNILGKSEDFLSSPMYLAYQVIVSPKGNSSSGRSFIILWSTA